LNKSRTCCHSSSDRPSSLPCGSASEEKSLGFSADRCEWTWVDLVTEEEGSLNLNERAQAPANRDAGGGGEAGRETQRIKDGARSPRYLVLGVTHLKRLSWA
jgi:hypothetical protein